MATILVIEDGLAMRSIIATYLRKHGHTIVEARTGHEGLRCHALGSGTFGLVVCDLILPELGGIEAIRTINAREPNLPILAISGGAKTLAYLRSCDTPGRRAYLVKPFLLADLVETVDRLLLESACPEKTLA